MVDLPHRVRIVAERTEVGSRQSTGIIGNVVALLQAARGRNAAVDGRVVADGHIARRIDQRIEFGIAAVLDIEIPYHDDNQISRITILIDLCVVADDQIALDVDPGRSRAWRSQYPVVGRDAARPVAVAHRNRPRTSRRQGRKRRSIEAW
ncbi:hypothetical protein D3C78_1214360 [compost metagenome]